MVPCIRPVNQGVRCGGTSYIIDLWLRFAHVAPPGDVSLGAGGLAEGTGGGGAASLRWRL